jgi:predicted alpha/beta superfamily hydrolase
VNGQRIVAAFVVAAGAMFVSGWAATPPQPRPEPTPAVATRPPPATATSTSPGRDLSGRIERYAPFPAQAVTPRDVFVWLPPGYDSSGERYAVLYVHDGQNLFDGTTSASGAGWNMDLHLAALELDGKARPAIVVGIANTRDRWREYAPQAALAGLPQELRDRLASEAGGEPLADRYLDFIVRELKPFVDSRFRTRPGRDDTFVMGSSMGGLISLYALLRYPDVFGAAACLSPHWPLSTSRELLLAPASVPARLISDAYITWIDRHLPVAGSHRFYFDHGTVFLDALYDGDQRRVDALGTAHGYRTDIDWMSRTFPGATHGEKAWDARLDVPLEFLLRP